MDLSNVLFCSRILVATPPLPPSPAPSSSTSYVFFYLYLLYIFPIPSCSSCPPLQKSTGGNPMGQTNVIFSSEISLADPPPSDPASSSSPSTNLPYLSPFYLFPCLSCPSWVPLKQSTGGNPMSLKYSIFFSLLLLTTPPSSDLAPSSFPFTVVLSLYYFFITCSYYLLRLLALCFCYLSLSSLITSKFGLYSLHLRKSPPPSSLVLSSNTMLEAGKPPCCFPAVYDAVSPPPLLGERWSSVLLPRGL